MSRALNDRIFDRINAFILLIVMIVCIYPLWFVIIASVSNPNAVWGGQVILLPKSVSINGYIRILKEDNVWVGYRNTIFYTTAGTILNVFLTVISAYPLSRKDFSFGKILISLYVFTMYFSGGLIPSYLVVKELGMVNKAWALIIPGAVSVYNIIITRTYFQNNIPVELLEASQIDGCSDIYYLAKIVIPLSKPILAVITMFYAVGHWNSFFSALIYLSDRKLYPLQLVLREMLLKSRIFVETVGADINAMEEMMISESMKYGLIIISTLPVLCFYPFVQRHFVKGIMLGAIKG